MNHPFRDDNDDIVPSGMMMINRPLWDNNKKLSQRDDDNESSLGMIKKITL